MAQLTVSRVKNILLHLVFFGSFLLLFSFPILLINIKMLNFILTA